MIPITPFLRGEGQLSFYPAGKYNRHDMMITKTLITMTLLQTDLHEEQPLFVSAYKRPSGAALGCQRKGVLHSAISANYR